jgi:hypothetical protein
MIFGVLAIAMPINVLGKNFTLEFDASQHAEDASRQDVFDAILMGLQEYAAKIQTVSPSTSISISTTL